MSARAPYAGRFVRPRAPRRGYTIIEVIIALAVLAAGASGVIAMQKATLLGNVNAQRLATANFVAMQWVERLRTDTLQWNNVGGLSDLGDTQFLSTALPAAPVGNGGWFTPTETASRGSPVADVLGADIFAGDPANPPPVPAYCTQIRLTQLYPTMIRTEVRVFWHRDGSQINCAGVPPADLNTDLQTYGYVYVTTGVQQNTQ